MPKGDRPPEVPTPEEVAQLIAAASPRYHTGTRARALIALLHGGGLRCAEALALCVADLDLGSGVVHVRHGKGNRSRFAATLPGTFAHLAPWLETRAPEAPTLLCTRDGRPLQPAYVRALLKRLARRAGIARRIHPHGLRHLHARTLDEAGWPLGMIRDQLGHASSATTDSYLRAVSPRRRVEAMRQMRVELDPDRRGCEIGAPCDAHRL